ncbi:MAG TPA: CHASE domain-containing protein [Kineosporiaceae bacterium]|nr:CHASE domain-containing protein [Kineosporiaceae bacterium]
MKDPLQLGWLQRSYRAVAVTVLLGGTIASAVYAQQWQASIDREQQAGTMRSVEDATARLENGFGRYQRGLGAERAFYAAVEGKVSYSQFRAFAAGLRVDENYPGMQGIGFQQPVAASELAGFIAQNQRQGRPQFTVKPPGERPEYFVIRYNEPVERLGMTWGLDARADPGSRPYLERARDTGEVMLSGKTVLVKDLALPKARQPVAFDLLMPVYRAGAPVETVTQRRAAFLGWASSTFRAQDFLNSFFPVGSDLGVEIFADAHDIERPIAVIPQGFNTAGRAAHTVTMSGGGHRWVLRFAPVEAGTAATESRWPVVALATGGAVSALLATLLWLFGSAGRQRATAAAALARELHERELVEADLDRSAAVFRRAFDDALVGMCFTSLDGRLLRVNPVLTRTLGRSAEELVGGRFSEFSHPDDLAANSDEIRRTVDGEIDGFTANQRYVRPDGSVVHVDLSTVLIRDEEGAPLHFATQTVDVTDRHRAQAEGEKHQRMLRSVIEKSQSLIYVKDLDGRYLMANEPFRQAFSVTEDELLGKSDAYLGPKLAPVWTVNDLHAQQGECRVDEWSDGEHGRRFYESVKLPLFDAEDKLYAICGISLDVTERRQAAAELRVATAATEEAARAAIEATHAKSAFLAAMSHEIRTPMNAVIGMTGLLLDTDLDDQQRDFVETVRDSGESLLTVINDILDFSKIEAGDVELESQPFELRDCVESALSLVALAASKKGLELVAQVEENCPAVVVGDATRFRQVIVNLLSNAVKFTEIGEVVVEITAAAEEPGSAGRPVQVQVAVRDTGIGIPANRIDRLFKAFSQVDASTTRVYGGTGLGLAISRKLARALGGDLQVESQVGQGSTFTFSALLQSAPDRRLPSAPTISESLVGKSVLIVDDNATNRRMLRLLMESWEMSCVEAAYPAEALDLLTGGSRVDVAILDLHMPEMDGQELAIALGDLPAGRGLPMILMSSLQSRPSATRDRLFAAMLTKPVKAKVLREKLLMSLTPIEATLRNIETAGGRREDDAPQSTSAPLRILLAEDNLINQQVAQLMLAKLGHRVDTVGNGLEAVEAIRRIPYDVVLMDMQMPEMDGLSATRTIRAGSPAEQTVPIIAMTASALLEDRAACARAGMNGYLTKPVRLAELASALEMAHRARPAAPTHDAPDGRGQEREEHLARRLQEMFEGLDPEVSAPLRRQLVDAFLADVPRRIDELSGQIALGDHQAVAQLAHSLLGIAGNLGAHILAHLSLKLEEDARAERLDDAGDILRQLDDEYHIVATSIVSV